MTKSILESMKEAYEILKNQPTTLDPDAAIGGVGTSILVEKIKSL